MLVNVNELKEQIKKISTLDGVLIFLQENDDVLKELENRAKIDIFDYHATIMNMLEAKQKSLQVKLLI